MGSSESDAVAAAAKVRYDRAVAEIRAKVKAKVSRADYLKSYARARGLDVTFSQVSAHLDIFERWHGGLIATGHLMNATGVKFIGRDDDKKGGE